jgi:hypothetical protein
LFITFLLYHSALCLYGAYLAFFSASAIVSEKQLFSAMYVDSMGQQISASAGIVFQVRPPSSCLVDEDCLSVGQYLMMRYGGLMATFLYTAMVGFTLFLFGMYHVYLVVRNTTTNESFKWDDAQQAETKAAREEKRKTVRLPNRYNRGIRSNLHEVFMLPAVAATDAAAAAKLRMQ